MCQIISYSKEKEKDFEKLLEYLLDSIKEKIREHSEDPTFNKLMLIQNYIIFFNGITKQSMSIELPKMKNIYLITSSHKSSFLVLII